MQKTWIRLVAYSLVLIVFTVSVIHRIVPQMADDGAFFLRYAENMAKGYFWVWNIGEAPVWGASAPLFPLFVALPIFLGMAPVKALLVSSIALSVAAFLVLFHTLFKREYYFASFFLVLFLCMDTGLMYFSSAGLETPLTFLLISLMVYCLFEESPAAILVGLSAGLLAVNKIDLGPISVVFLLYYLVWKREIFKKSIVIYLTLVFSWYAFAWLYFGAPVPNSFLTKALHQDHMLHIIDRRWFAKFVLYEGIHRYLVPFFGLACFCFYRFLDRKTLVLIALMAIHFIAYTLKPPFEPYNWYTMPSVVTLIFLSAYGVQLWAGLFKNRKWALVACLVAGIAFTKLTLKTELEGTKILQHMTDLYEGDRAEAGIWVDKNLPKEFKVFTGWGNPAYFSQRYVYDGSFLNRKFEEGSLVDIYKPEVLIMQGNPGSTPENPVYGFHSGKGYTTVKTFAKTFAEGQDYYFAVLVRDDLLSTLNVQNN